MILNNINEICLELRQLEKENLESLIEYGILLRRIRIHNEIVVNEKNDIYELITILEEKIKNVKNPKEEKTYKVGMAYVAGSFTENMELIEAIGALREAIPSLDRETKKIVKMKLISILEI